MDAELYYIRSIVSVEFFMLSYTASDVDLLFFGSSFLYPANDLKRNKTWSSVSNSSFKSSLGIIIFGLKKFESKKNLRLKEF